MFGRITLLSFAVSTSAWSPTSAPATAAVTDAPTDAPTSPPNADPHNGHAALKTHSPAQTRVLQMTGTTPCINPSRCQCPCGWEKPDPTGTCRFSDGAVSMEYPTVDWPHMGHCSLELCKTYCEDTPGCVAIDHAMHGDSRCWLYSACPNPNFYASAKQNAASFYGHRTVCSDKPCSITNAPAQAGLASALVGQSVCGWTITAAVLSDVNKYVLTLTGGDCTTVQGTTCKGDISTLVENTANVMAHQVSVSVDSCTSERRAAALSTPTATVTVTIVNPQPSVSGDPFVTYKGKSTQFYLKLGQSTKLLKCGAMELFGRTFTSKIEGDTQQWFDQYQVKVGAYNMIISTRSVDLKGAKASEESDIKVEDNKDRVSEILKAALERTRNAQKLAKERKQKLSTIDITIEDDAAAEVSVASPGIIPFIGAENMTAAVTQDLSSFVGQGYKETVDVQIPQSGISMQVKTAIAQKFSKQSEQLNFLHLDLLFPQIDASRCSGPLPEIWGVRPMTMATSKLLTPPEA